MILTLYHTIMIIDVPEENPFGNIVGSEEKMLVTSNVFY